MDAAIHWLEGRSRTDDEPPVFLWLHLMDPHAGYAPPEPYPDRFVDRPAAPSKSFLGPTLPERLIHSQAQRPGEYRWAAYVDRYDAEIRYLDDQLGRLFDVLRAQGRYDDAVIVFTADHGEYMGESNDVTPVFSLGKTLFEGELRVPLIVKPPGTSTAEPGTHSAGTHSAATRVRRLVSLTDVVPTLLSFAGLPDRSSQGVALVDSILGGERAPRTEAIFAQAPRDLAKFSVRAERHKLIFESGLPTSQVIETLHEGNSVEGEYQLYDLHEDPYERNPITSGEEETAKRLADLLAGWLASSPVLDAPPRQTTDDEEVLRHLRALGYVDDE